MQPEVSGELEEHPFAASFGAEERGAGELEQGVLRGRAEDAFVRVALDGDDLSAEARVPLAAIIFDFSEFRHGGTFQFSFEMRQIR